MKLVPICGTFLACLWASHASTIRFSPSGAELAKNESEHREELLFHQHTPFQVVEVLHDPEANDMALRLDGKIQFSANEEGPYHEMMAHVPLQALQAPAENLLVIGGGDGGVTLRALQHRSLKHIVQVEPDAVLVNVSRKFFPQLAQAFDDDRVELHLMDALSWVQQNARSHEAFFDACVIDTKGQQVLSWNRNFFVALRHLLRPKGALMQVANNDPVSEADLFRLHRHTFPYVHVVVLNRSDEAPSKVAFLSSTDLRCAAPGLDAETREGSLHARWYSSAAHRAALVLPQWASENIGQLRSDSNGCLLEPRVAGNIESQIEKAMKSLLVDRAHKSQNMSLSRHQSMDSAVSQKGWSQNKKDKSERERGHHTARSGGSGRVRGGKR